LTGVLHLDDDVAALATMAVPALDDPALVDDSAADARAQGEEYEAARVPPRAGPVFAVGRGVGIVLQDRLLVQLLRKQIADRQMIPSRQVGRLEKHPAREVHCARRAEPDPGDLVPGQATRRYRAAARFGQLGDADFWSAVGLGLQAHRRQRLSHIVDHATLDVRSTKVDTQVVRWSAVVSTHGKLTSTDRRPQGSMCRKFQALAIYGLREPRSIGRWGLCRQPGEGYTGIAGSRGLTASGRGLLRGFV